MLVVTDLSVSPWPNERAVITIGAYDGVHRGHRAVIAQVQARAAELGARSVVVTFDRHPASVIRPDAAPRLLTNPAQKLELLADTGVDATVVVPFSPEQARETPVDFVERVIVNALRTQAVIVGSDFHFGHMRQGNITLLREMGERHDFTCEPVVLVPRADGVDEPISSTAIRRALAGGEIETATRLLGRALEVRGTVVTGDQRGRTIGFATANVEIPNGMCLPSDGVYAGLYRRPDGSEHACAINLGRRPTFYVNAEHSLLEAHLLDFAGDLYGEDAAVTFVAFLRSEKQFAGIDELKTQLKLDVEHARVAVQTYKQQ
ncbi:MAG: bifunctional riboflavin kinase/FAD synthetase [Actinobacteria bacterium]|nr:bifunctional riboflavin kinase/FAD synthetase [Actinomycetota bacterium]